MYIIIIIRSVVLRTKTDEHILQICSLLATARPDINVIVDWVQNTKLYTLATDGEREYVAEISPWKV